MVCSNKVVLGTETPQGDYASDSRIVYEVRSNEGYLHKRILGISFFIK